jgi:hypothetical protein
MNLSVVTLIASFLSAPALVGLLDGSVGPDQAGVRVLLAVLFAVVIERVVRRFVEAVAPPERSREAGLAPVPDDEAPRRRRSDG